MEGLDQIKAGVKSAADALSGSSSGQTRLPTEVYTNLPKFIAMLQEVFDHIDELERNAKTHRQLSHDWDLNGHAQLGLKVTLIANYEDTIRTALTLRMLEAWHGG